MNDFIKEEVFHYSTQLKWILTLGGIFFMVFFIISSWGIMYEDWGLSSIWMPVAFFMFGGLSCITAYPLHGHIVIDNESISYKRFGKETRIRYQDIIKITHHLTFHQMRILAKDQHICIDKKLNSFQRFYELITTRYSSLPDEFKTEFPLEISSRRWNLLIMGVLALIFVISAIFEVFSGFMHFFPILFSGIIIYLWLRTEKKYFFNSMSIKVFYPFKNKIFLTSSLENISLKRNYNSHSCAESTTIHLDFLDSFIIIDDDIKYPIRSFVHSSKKGVS